MTYRNEQRKEPLQQHEFVGRPWSKVAIDLCDLDKRNLLVISDYFRNYIHVERFQSVTSPGTCTSKLADRSYMVKVDDMEYCWFSHDVTKIETTKLLTLLRLIS